jgi:DNA-binding NarL/FixJ family response regulator
MLGVVPIVGPTSRRIGRVLTYEGPTNAIALTPRQWEVLQLFLQGLRVATISSRLGVSRSTVRNHLATIFQKCGVHSQSALIEFFRNRAPITVHYDGHSKTIWQQ